MSLASGILKLYPAADIRRDWRVQDDSDGRGPRIVHWDGEKLGPQPDEATLLAAGAEFDAEQATKAQERDLMEAQLRDVDPETLSADKPEQLAEVLKILLRRAQ